MTETSIEASPDVIVVSADSVAWGDYFEVSCEIVNPGDVPLDFATATFYLYSDPNDPATRVELGSYETEHWLGPQESETATLVLQGFPMLENGNYYVGYEITASNLASDSVVSAVSTAPISVVDLETMPEATVRVIGDAGELTDLQIEIADATVGRELGVIQTTGLENPTFAVKIDGVPATVLVVDGGVLRIAEALGVGVYSNVVVSATTGETIVYSAPFALTIYQAPVPPQQLDAPIIVAFSATSELLATWTSVDGALEYRVEFDLDPNFVNPVAYTTSATNYRAPLVGAATEFYCRVKALGHENYLESAWSGVANAIVPENYNDAIWNLDDYASYKSFKLDATPDANITATLYGQEKDGTYSELQSWDYVGADAIATITGRNTKAENLWITEAAMTLLGGVEFNGGDLLLDALRVDGTDAADQIAIGTETVVVETPIYTTNPYEKVLERYREQYGETSKTYLTIKANLDKAYERLSKLVARKTSTYGVVDLNGTIVKYLGVNDVAINTGAGDDSITVDALHYNYAIASTDGANALDFSNAQGRLNLDLGATYRQIPIIGDGGTLRLDGVYTTVVGTAGDDRVVGATNGLNFNGVSGSDSVTLVGGQNDVTLDGPRQSVIARGTGAYRIAIDNGDYSVVNASGASRDAFVTVAATGRRVSVFGGNGALDAQIVGAFATVNAGATQRAGVDVQGDHATITTGIGADVIGVAGDYATITTGAGADQVVVFGADANVRLGDGADFLTIQDGQSGRVGNNRVWGDGGNDVITAVNASGVNYLYAGAGNDVVVGGSGDDYIYANAGNNVLVGLGGADRLFGGTGRDVLIASTTTNSEGWETLDREALEQVYEQLYRAWNVDQDMEATLEILGEQCVADGVKDWVYRGGGRRNLVYASQLDVDFENALAKNPFNDELKLD